jgi:hypothetical protein
MSKDTFNIHKYKADPVSDTVDIVYNEQLEIYESKFVRPSFADGSDAYGNKYKTYLSFQNIRNEEQEVYFKAFITAFNESYTPNFNPTEVFGRTDPIMQYKNTTRNITLAWKLPAASESEAFENLAKTQTLLQMLYPTYTDVGNSLTLSEAPLVRLKLMNLLQSHGTIQPPSSGDRATTSLTQDFGGYKSRVEPKFGLLGAITSCTVNHNLEGSDGVFHKFDDQGKFQHNTILPKLIDININFTPLHEQTLGYSKQEETQGIKTFPYRLEPGLGMAGTSPISTSPPRGKSLSELRAIKRDIEAKRRSASEQQNLDRKKARALRLQDKFMAAEAGSRREDRLAGRSVRADRRAEVNGFDLADTRDSALETLAEAEALEQLI